MATNKELENEELDDEIEETEENEAEPKEKKTTQKNHGAFGDVIKAYLDGYSKEDAIFAERYANPDKNINDCCNYVINQVKNSGRNGFADEEIFALARGYYTDDVDAKDLKQINAKVVVNHQIELTESEKAKAKEEALKEFQAKELKALEEAKKKELERQKALEEKKAKAEAERKAKEEQARLEKEAREKELAKARGYEQMDLFGMFGDLNES